MVGKNLFAAPPPTFGRPAGPAVGLAPGAAAARTNRRMRDQSAARSLAFRPPRRYNG